MRIESIGLPGSGKSTLIRETVKALNDAGHKAIDSNALDEIDKKVGKGMHVLRREERTRQAIHFAQFMQSHAVLFGHFQALHGDAVRNLTLLATVGADLEKYNGSHSHYDSFWADEGFLHQLAYAVLKVCEWDAERALQRVPNVLALIPDPGLTIFTEVDPDIAIKSLLQRMGGTNRGEKAKKKRFEENFGGVEGMQARAKVLEAIASGLEARGANVFRIKGQENLPKMVFETINKVAPGLAVG